jgi:serine/threonine-protein kinase HipA
MNHICACRLHSSHRASGHYCRACNTAMFGKQLVNTQLDFNFDNDDDEYLTAKFTPNNRISISGVQIKILLTLHDKQLRLSELGERGTYILKPAPTDIGLFHKNDIPANEHLTMQIAQQVFGIPTATNGLVTLSNGKYAYLTKRFDIQPDGTSKYIVEDFATLANKNKENEGDNFKYNYSYLELAELVKRYCNDNTTQQLIRFYTLVLFNYLFSNGDAHLKNFSIISYQNGKYQLSPIYDLLCTRLHINDTDFALFNALYDNDTQHPSYAIYGYHTGAVFKTFGKQIGLNTQRINAIFNTFLSEKTEQKVMQLINHSFLNENLKQKYRSLFLERKKRLSQ